MHMVRHHFHFKNIKILFFLHRKHDFLKTFIYPINKHFSPVLRTENNVISATINCCLCSSVFTFHIHIYYNIYLYAIFERKLAFIPRLKHLGFPARNTKVYCNILHIIESYNVFFILHSFSHSFSSVNKN